MGNYITLHTSSPHPASGKLILSDGTVQEFDDPITVAELMLEYPQQVVVEFQPELTRRKPVALPADKKLEMKKVYLMLPVKRGKPASLSSDETRHVLLSANSVLRSKSLLSSTRLFPLLGWMCSAVPGHDAQNCTVTMQKKECDQNLGEKNSVPELLTPEILENRPEYLTRTLSGKGWKPSLDTIVEKKSEVKVKVNHWLF